MGGGHLEIKLPDEQLFPVKPFVLQQLEVPGPDLFFAQLNGMHTLTVAFRLSCPDLLTLIDLKLTLVAVDLTGGDDGVSTHINGLITGDCFELGRELFHASTDADNFGATNGGDFSKQFAVFRFSCLSYLYQLAGFCDLDPRAG